MQDRINLQLLQFQDKNTRLCVTIKKLQSDIIKAQHYLKQAAMEKKNLQNKMEMFQLCLERQNGTIYNQGMGGSGFWGGLN